MAIERQVNAASYILDIEMLVPCFDFGRTDFFDLDAKGPRHRRLTMYLFQPLGCQGRGDRADPFETGGHACFCLKAAVEFLGVLGEFRHVRRRAQLCDQASGMPCGARGEGFAFQQNDVFPPQFGKMIRDGASNDASSDDDYAGRCGQVGHG